MARNKKTETETKIENAQDVENTSNVENGVTDPVPADGVAAITPDESPKDQTPDADTEKKPTPETTEPKTTEPIDVADDQSETTDPKPEPAVIPVPEPEVIEDHEEEHNTPLSTHVLRGLFLIVIGIALALWGAPKLAPMLPSGLAPVAEFLMPGQSEAKADVAALRADMETRIAAAETAAANAAADPKAVQSAINTALESYNATLSTELAAIKDALAATDGKDIEARLATLETQIQGVNAELGAVSERLSRQITENGVALSEEAGSKLAGYQAALEGLKAQVAELASKNGALSQKVEDIASASARRVEQAQADASTKVASTTTKKLLTVISAALETGGPFKPSLDGLMEISKTEPPADLAAIAATGTASWTTLRNGFTDMAHKALRVDAKANADDGVIGKLGAFLQTKIGTRSLERTDGPSTDAILSRVEDDLVNRRLSAALTEANSLPEAPKAAMADWIAQLSALTKAQAALDALTAELGAN